MPDISYTLGGDYDPNDSQTYAIQMPIDPGDTLKLYADAGSNNQFALYDETKNTTEYLTEVDGFTPLTAQNAGLNVDFSTQTGVTIIDGGDYGDVLVGGTYIDVFSSSGGMDLLQANGYSTLHAGIGMDNFQGAQGATNEVDFSLSSQGEKVYLDTPALNTGDAQGDTYTNVNNLIGSDYADTFTGSAAGLSFSGRGGDDRFAIGATPLFIDGGAGTDTLTITASGNVTLTTTSFQNIEHVSVRDGATLDMSGVASLETPKGISSASTNNAVTITGTQGNDHITGGAAADILNGYDGNDTITGGSGGDMFNGGLGVDTLRAGSGADTFAYGAVADSMAGSGNRDKILGFDPSADKIDLTLLEQSTNESFTYIGNQAFDGTAGELRVVTRGSNTFAQVDTTGSGHADFEIQLKGALALAAGNFTL